MEHLKDIHVQLSTLNVCFESLFTCFGDLLKRNGQFLSLSSCFISLCQVLQARTCGMCRQEMNYPGKSRIRGLDSSYCVVLNCIVLLPQLLPSFSSFSDLKHLEMR